MTPPLQATGLGIKWFEAAIQLLIQWLRDPIEGGLGNLADLFFATPLPATGSGVDRVFGAPPASDEPWHSIYTSVVGGDIMVFALLVLFACVQGRHTVRIFNVGSGYETRRAQRSAWTGAVLIVAWYWIAVLTLYFVEGLTVALLPDLAGIGQMLLGILPTALSNPALSLLMSVIGALAMLCMEAVFFVRHILLYGYLYLMPIGLAVAFGNIPILSRIARGMCRQFVPLAVLPVPAAFLFRTYDLLFGNGYLAGSTPFLRFLVVVSLPVLSLYVSWKTFEYASPLTARIMRGTATTALTVGAVAGASSIAGPRVASTAARYGPTTAAGEAAVRGFAGPTTGRSSKGNRDSREERNTTDTSQEWSGRSHVQNERAAYRRGQGSTLTPARPTGRTSRETQPSTLSGDDPESEGDRDSVQTPNSRAAGKATGDDDESSTGEGRDSSVLNRAERKRIREMESRHNADSGGESGGGPERDSTETNDET